MSHDCHYAWSQFRFTLYHIKIYIWCICMLQALFIACVMSVQYTQAIFNHITLQLKPSSINHLWFSSVFSPRFYRNVLKWRCKVVDSSIKYVCLQADVDEKLNVNNECYFSQKTHFDGYSLLGRHSLVENKQTFKFSADRGAEGNRGTSVPG